MQLMKMSSQVIGARHNRFIVLIQITYNETLCDTTKRIHHNKQAGVSIL